MTDKRYQPFECRTIDGLTLRGLLFAVPGPAPAIVMTHGFNSVKEMLLPEAAETYQSLGYNVLIYDGRSVGASDGQPRNQPSPYQMAEDVSDLTYHKLALFRPKELMAEIEGVPVMMVVPELDDISSPVEQRAAFEAMTSTPKRLYEGKGMGHFNILTCDGSAEMLKATADFFQDALEGKVV
ncbi:hypothetical protein MAPG_09434 [Magnaporthiopsis poae ATCC 64411]|uniref:Serine aminopeptidase S33 domain-containing protein n=1 Tax=Magnaporthiopsis poae (strain ATCC 64411 / 73-15) TaxID=644358 RepID=A0A0C4E9Y2_MAGP6|nr:hypothetical protein MAPG_09434 [Magnaporthiopsis poae ATCC 64411]